jgi:signal transduction histidine kinase
VTGAPVALFAVDPAGILTLGEGRVLSALGMEPETVGRRMLEVDTIPARVRDIVSRSLEWGDPASTVVEVGGRALDLRITPRFGADDRFEGITGTATDITERIRAEDALRDKIEVEQLLLRISTDLAGLPAERVDRGVQGALGQIGAFVGSTRASVFIHDELHGSWSMAHEWVAPNATPHRDRLQGVPVTAYPWLWSRLVSGRIVHIPDVDNLPMEAWTTRDVWRDLGIATICMLPIIVSGRMAGFVSVDRETRLPFSDRDLMLLRIAAEMLVAALDRKLAHDRLAELVRSKDEFVASVSHELRTPLTTVVGLADELRDRPGGFDQEEAAQLHRLIAEEAGEVAAIVDDLLVVARADLGKVSLHTAYCDVAREVDTVLRVLPIESRQRVTVKSVDLSIWADPGRVRQIVRNLISNALRYGGSRIEIEVGTRHGVAAIEVSDDGDGVAPQEVERMFEPYHHTRLIAGGPSSIGLGLTVARKLARLMGGDVTYRRDRGWSVFTLTLPLADSAAT